METANGNFSAKLMFLLAVSGFLACSEPDNFTVEIVDGVRFVHNQSPKWGDSPKVELKFIRSIGGLDAEDENFQFYRTNDVIKDESDNIYVLDTGNNRIQKFDSEGRYIKTIGQEGQGPGEFLNPTSMIIDSQGMLHIADMRNYRVEKFSLEGEAIASYKMSKMFTSFRLLNENEMVVPVVNITAPGLPGTDGTPSLVSVISNDGEIVRSFGELKKYEEPTLTGLANVVFVAVDDQKNIYATYGMENKIEKFSVDGNLLLRFDRPIPFEITHEMTTRTMETGGREITVPIPKVTMVSYGCEIDVKGRLWMETFNRKPTIPEDETKPRDSNNKPARHFEIYDAEGVWLGKIPKPEELEMARIQGDVMFLIDKSNTEVHEYRIIEK